MNNEHLKNYLNNFWDNNITPTLIDYIKIPNKSPAFDSNWEANGHMDRVLDLAVSWTKEHMPMGGKLTIKHTVGRTPLILVDIPGEKDGNVLMYGHLDKQPEMEGWDEGLGPWKPVLKDEKLYGRGGADDGYALFASIGVVNALQEQNIPLPRILILIEFCEESGSPDLPHYIDLCSETIGSPNLVVCLDSGAGDYERFWTTTSLRGLVGCTMRVDVLSEGVHSGSASGLVPSSFRVARELLSKIEDPKTGSVLVDTLHTEIPEHRIKEVEKMVSILGSSVVEDFPFVDSMKPSTGDLVEAVLRSTWRPALSVVGADGLPEGEKAGNVLRPYTSLKLSMRIPPMVDAPKAQDALVKVLTDAPPYDAKVKIETEEAALGWNAPKTELWLESAIEKASTEFYGHSASALGEGGTIPFMAMLGEKFPDAQFIITGVLGPASNAHGPNEFLHIPYAKKLSCCVASVLAEHP
ncbi:MAG: M20/M25/M40 family metallo-hydrolase [Candidatus Marinimicrobia bacterium]|jgi:acetylornithine deacetylase/succinyl-diaminopimelate desuccinylase-like protein|nr:M20/M25/M40 family metallo-hydrolase [Candidatus Neomarinimicrobiota bacterium]MBT4684803.1 M20/M25/M40 family metallo-hydrolase [Candidatus Neomarinimicrobiota bacterium]MBT4736394.1 M20/M25/M40 family metallo-hydrolase [Candidatus Neomarinimicrobiota bacterium]MBT5069662.1 M20/M25/M40 family metallo-hydrolase [Candidatus Neomarinimicrobiota bacterium]MBT5994190.1 M20/M25/M40 family metallo-hydrolase [Candidatus Neomarinimicrobiota bacterium]